MNIGKGTISHGRAAHQRVVTIVDWFDGDSFGVVMRFFIVLARRIRVSAMYAQQTPHNEASHVDACMDAITACARPQEKMCRSRGVARARGHSSRDQYCRLGRRECSITCAANRRDNEPRANAIPEPDARLNGKEGQVFEHMRGKIRRSRRSPRARCVAC